MVPAQQHLNRYRTSASRPCEQPHRDWKFRLTDCDGFSSVPTPRIWRTVASRMIYREPMNANIKAMSSVHRQGGEDAFYRCLCAIAFILSRILEILAPSCMVAGYAHRDGVLRRTPLLLKSLELLWTFGESLLQYSLIPGEFRVAAGYCALGEAGEERIQRTVRPTNLCCSERV